MRVSLLTFADPLDLAMMSMGSLGAILAAALDVSFREFYARLIDESSTPSFDLLSKVATICWQLTVLGVALAIASLIQVFLRRRTLQRQMIKMRTELFQSILRRPIAFFDHQTPAHLQNLLSARANAVSSRLIHQPSALIYHLAIVLGGIAWGFARIWGVALVWFGAFPLVTIALMIMAKIANFYVVKALDVQSETQAFVSEVLHNIRVVQCFNRQLQTLDKYRTMMARYLPLSVNSEHATICSRGFGLWGLYTMYGLELIVGLALVEGGYATAGTAIAGAFNFHNITISVVTANDCLKDLLLAASKMEEVVKLIQDEVDIAPPEEVTTNSDSMKPPLDSNSALDAYWASALSRVVKVSFNAVSFRYSEPEEEENGESATDSEQPAAALDDQAPQSPLRRRGVPGSVFHFDECVAEVGQPVAVVGPSGGGKSTCGALLMKFYTPQQGRILLHLLPSEEPATTNPEQNLTAQESEEANDPYTLPKVQSQQQPNSNGAEEVIDLNAVPAHVWYDYITYVPQEPQLFRLSIRENIRIALPTATDADVERVCREVMLHDTIMSLPQGYETVCSGTAGLSGGERQRMSIARMLLRNTPINILDEPTSALDRATEEVINELLRGLLRQPNKITLLITHRTTLLPDVQTVYTLEKGVLRQVPPDHDYTSQTLNSSFGGLRESGRSKSTLGSSLVSMSRRNSLSNLQVLNDSVTSNDAPIGRKLSIRRRSSAGSSTTSETSNPPSPMKGVTQVQQPQGAECSCSNWEVFQVVFNYTTGHRWCMLAGLLGSLAYGSHHPLYGYVVARVTELLAAAGRTPTPSQRAEFYSLTGGFLVIAVGAGIGYSLGSYWTRCAEAAACRMRVDAVTAVLRRTERYFVTRPLSVVNEIIGPHSDEIKYSLEIVPGKFLHAVVAAAIGISLSFSYNATLSAIALICWPFIVMNGIWADVNNRRPSAMDLMSNAVVYESALQIRIVKSLKLETDQSECFEEYLLDDFRRTAYSVAWESALTAFSRFTYYGTYALLFWYGTKLISEGKCSFLDLNIVLHLMIRSAIQCGEVLGNLPVLLKSLEGARALIALTRDPVDEDAECICNTDLGPGKHCAVNAPPRITEPISTRLTANELLVVKDLTFRHPVSGTELLRWLIVNLPAGKVTTILGRSGSGKSTFLLLLSGYFKKEFTGDISLHRSTATTPSREVDDAATEVTVRDASSRHWRSLVSYVPQEPMLFSGTIRENIIYGSEDEVCIEAAGPTGATERLQEVLKAACLTDDLERFRDGLDTQVGYLGTKLSGGQRQRIAIARGLYRQSKVLLLDEFTAALPKEMKLNVAEKVYEMARAEGRITVSVAHDEDVLSLGDSSFHIRQDV